MTAKLIEHWWLGALFTLLGFSLFWAGNNFSPFEIAAGTLLLVTAALVLVARKDFLTIPQHLYWLGGFASLLLIQTLYLSKSVFFNLVTLYLMAIFFVVRAWYREYPALFWSLMAGYLAGAVLSAFWGLFLFAADPWLDTWATGQRYMGLLNDPEMYGALLVPAVLVFAVLFFSESTRRNLWLYGSMTLVALCGIVLSGSQGAWLNLVVAVSLVVVFSPSLHGRIVLLQKVLPLAACGLVLATSILHLIPLNGSTFYETTLIKRLDASEPISNRFKIISEDRMDNAPLVLMLGQGGGATERLSKEAKPVHNTYVRVLFEQGLIGLFLFAGFLAHSLFGTVGGDKLDRRTTILAVAAVGGILAQSFLVDTLHWRHWWLLLALIL